MSNRVPDSVVRGYYQRYQAGESVDAIGRSVGRTGASLYSLFKARGWALRGRMNPMPLRVSEEVIREMHADHLAGVSFCAIGRKHGRAASTVRELLATRGLELRESRQCDRNRQRRKNGTYLAKPKLSKAAIDRMIAEATSFRIPDELKNTWRSWPLWKQSVYIDRVRAKLGNPGGMAKGPFSANVKRWSFGDYEAHRIADMTNEGRDSRHARTNIKPASQGVIYKGELWFWRPQVGFVKGKAGDRKALHRAIFEEFHGPIPAKHVVSFADGNCNNHDPTNLIARPKAEIGPENKARYLDRRARKALGAVLNRHKKKDTNDLTSQLLGAASAR